MVKENSYICIQAFMVNDLHLKGNELLVYAIIWGFSQDGESEFTGSLQYLADWTCSTKQGVMKALQDLCERHLILKNVEYKNNIRFCTYKTTVLNKVERGIKQSLMGYATEFNGGMQQSLPNNINNTLENNQEYTQEEIVPAYVSQPLKITQSDYQTLVNNCFSMIAEHNKSAIHKIPISKAMMYFSQKEGRQILSLCKEYDAIEIQDALKNFLASADVESWKSSFSFNAFCNNISEYLPEYFDISKYTTIPKNKDEVQAITDAFAQEHKNDKWFDLAVFHHHREDWMKAGKPEGADFEKWSDKVYAEDEKNGRLDEKGMYL